MFATLKSVSLLVSEVCRAWMENDANGMVLVAGSVVPDFAISDGGIQAKCDRLLGNPVELDGSGGNVDEEGTQKPRAEFGATEAPPGVVLAKGGENPVWSRSISLES
jgi:hypothetical protein